MLLLQIPDPTKVIDAATGVSWEAGMLALVMVTCMGVIVYMVKRQNDNVSQERIVAESRENRMAQRMNEMENDLRRLEKENSDQLLAMSKEMARAIAESTSARMSVHSAVSELTRANATLNSDLKELCSLLKLSPCIAIGTLRGHYKLIDDHGNEIELVKRTDSSIQNVNPQG